MTTASGHSTLKQFQHFVLDVRRDEIKLFGQWLAEMKEIFV